MGMSLRCLVHIRVASSGTQVSIQAQLLSRYLSGLSHLGYEIGTRLTLISSFLRRSIKTKPKTPLWFPLFLYQLADLKSTLSSIPS